tara:strand:- start:332 stop:760 length:429 start_codon:yes stop_codon:yes gene_type:complete
MPYKDKAKEKQYMTEWRERNKDKIKQQNKVYNKEYRKKNSEKQKEQKNEYMKGYRQRPQGKKCLIIGRWKHSGLLETKEKMEELYKIYTTIKLCEACDIELTRSGKNSSTDINLDHCHETGIFRFMLCGTCNRQDNWKKHFC